MTTRAHNVAPTLKRTNFDLHGPERRRHCMGANHSILIAGLPALTEKMTGALNITKDLVLLPGCAQCTTFICNQLPSHLR